MCARTPHDLWLLYCYQDGVKDKASDGSGPPSLEMALSEVALKKSSSIGWGTIEQMVML